MLYIRCGDSLVEMHIVHNLNKYPMNQYALYTAHVHTYSYIVDFKCYCSSVYKRLLKASGMCSYLCAFEIDSLTKVSGIIESTRYICIQHLNENSFSQINKYEMGDRIVLLHCNYVTLCM